jgi:LysM repeat protein
MQRKLVSCFVLMIALAVRSFAQDEASIRRYIDQYKLLAIAEQKRSGVPAAITLAQGIHETQAGGSELATQANNHFGIKCKKDWKGETFAHTDDAPDECFRKYKRAEDSYMDHSNYLSKTPRYSSLFKLSVTDYAGWAFGLKQCGYATNPKYARVLIQLVEDYHLQQFTYDAMDSDLGSKYAIPTEVVPEHDAPAEEVAVAKPIEVPVIATNTPAITMAPEPSAMPAAETTELVPSVNTPSPDTSTNNNPTTTKAEQKTEEAQPSMPPYGQVVKINNLKAVYAKKGDMPLEYAIKNNLRYERLLEINEIDERPLPMDMFLYLERKNFRGVRPIHEVKEGETMFLIAQAEGMQIKNLRSLNIMQQGDEPEPGTVLELQKQAARRPTIIRKEMGQPNPPTPPAEQVVAAPIEQFEPRTNTSSTKNIEELKKEEPVVVEVAKNAEKPKAVPPPTPEIVAGGDKAQAVEAKEPATVPQPPAEPKTDVITAKTEEKNTSPDIVGPPSSPNDIPAKPIEQPKAATPVVEAPSPAKQPQAEPAQEEPKTELDQLKSRFDKVVYAKPKPVETTTTKEEEPKQTPKETATTSATPKYYVVKKGDTAFSIAKANNITMRQLMDMNSLDFAEIKVGQKLRVQ